ISEIIDKYKFDAKITEEDIIKLIKEEKKNIKEKFTLFRERIRFLSKIIYMIENGQDIIDSLQFHNINEIGIINKNYIYIVYKGRKIWLSFLKILDKAILEKIQKKSTQNKKPQFDTSNPIVIASKNNGNRVTVAGYIATPDEEEMYYNERIFNLKKITLEEMRDKYKTINEPIYKLLMLNQKGRGTHLITGSDMGVGKTTFLTSMMEKIPDKWGIGIIDTQNEIQARNKYPWKNIITLIENPLISIEECFEYMLKMARDVLYVGEIVNPQEIAQLINASLRLNAGAGATLHSKTPFEVVANCRNLMMRTTMYDNSIIAETDIARALDLIIHLEKHPNEKGRIIVKNIVEVEYIEKNIDTKVVLEGSKEEKINNILNLAQLALQKYLQPKLYRYREIFEYKANKNIWILKNLPSNEYFKKISNFVLEKEIQEFKNNLQPKGCDLI
ncbi:P-loop NTPase family protein, partial [Paramaledivibacter caminithermalis]